MTPFSALITALQAVPAKVRGGIYIGFAAVGVALGVLDINNVDALFGVSVEAASTTYWYLAPILGVTAAANITPTDDSGSPDPHDHLEGGDRASV